MVVDVKMQTEYGSSSFGVGIPEVFNGGNLAPFTDPRVSPLDLTMVAAGEVRSGGE